ncbi:MAG: molybdenum cofactor guanylyltransferase [Spirochaetales bacterium]|uniref:Probable molybdenum cofactor guanylyltransferase n=1 Tax=Candidatus Thalassospirochaeta sargassi TaxID=3119039 RepID=A0AAJ1IHM4_9SPIO|nr:molybdenum cofactor guanylyltransferase [Spirochaetales bacterium]
MSTKSALILAGGESRRFGSNKALAPFGDTTLIEHIISRLEPLFEEIIISANNPEIYSRLGLPVCEDLLPETGPLAGLHAGLKAAASDYVFVTACDMPYVTPDIIGQMRSILVKTNPDAIVPARNGFIEPFHGFYSKRLILEIEATEQSASGGMFSFIQKVKSQALPCSDEKIFININTPEKLDELNRGVFSKDN